MDGVVRRSSKVLVLAMSVCAAVSASGNGLGDWQKARVLKGLWGEGCSAGAAGAEGTVQIKCGKVNASGIAKVSMVITPFRGKRVALRAVSVAVSGDGEAQAEWPAVPYQVHIRGDGGFFGEPIYYGARPCCSPDAVWSAEVGGPLPDGAYALGSSLAYLSDAEYWEFHDVFQAAAGSGYCLHTEMFMPFFREQPFTVTGGRPDFGRTPSLKYKLVEGQPTLVGLGTAPNVPGTKLSYNAKTGLFKGSLKLNMDPYVCTDYDEPPKRAFQLKKFSFKLAGVVANGEGVGLAFCAKPSYACSMYLYQAW